MRQSRRGCFYQNKEPKYIWKVYDIGTQLNGGTIGSISIRSNRTKMASTTFTYSNGTFTLTNPKSKTITNLSVGDYIVDIQTTTAGANITSGSAIYKVTGKSGSSNITLSYTKYTSMKNIQGSTYYYDVASDTLDYPIDGEQDGYWYVMVKGEREIYVYNQYNTEIHQGTVTFREWEKKNSNGVNLYYNVSQKAIYQDGTYTLVAPIISGVSPSTTYIGYFCRFASGSIYVTGGLRDNYPLTIYSTHLKINSRELTGQIEFEEPDIFPQSGFCFEIDGTTFLELLTEGGTKQITGYEYSHSYMKKFDNR